MQHTQEGAESVSTRYVDQVHDRCVQLIPSRLRRKRIVDLPSAAVSPKTPEGMELWIRTPTPSPMQLMWAHTLPWIRFQDKVLPSE